MPHFTTTGARRGIEGWALAPADVLDVRAAGMEGKIHSDLDVSIVSFGSSKQEVVDFVENGIRI